MSFQNGEHATNDLSNTNLNEDNIVELIPQKLSMEEVNKKNKSNNCKELQNIAYKTKRFNGTEIVPQIVNTNNSTLSNFLNNETIANEKENWCKLDKTQKVKKLINYVQLLENKYNLVSEESNKCKSYLIKCLERKALSKAKDVIYDKVSGAIVDIPHLLFDTISRNFMLKKDDKHVSTVKSLPLDKKMKAKTIKIHDMGDM
uniref:Uncharacterized protein n=1 Tax=viral metagenome TaxID=1070528 RepID=A0A6C0DW69_9ZZZZ